MLSGEIALKNNHYYFYYYYYIEYIVFSLLGISTTFLSDLQSIYVHGEVCFLPKTTIILHPKNENTIIWTVLACL